ncbi:RHS repeat-associated core domain-containing protein [Pseudoalteromonas sp. S2893]|uniref:RHS repeat-associated core domain-containing protein n=1 Tax=Pseudoalteromonas sp. S2893 TaxID=579530 RepID=UPI00110B1F8B|nr:RHS repeat-associated core domain-containing protein [Pseudoalteromonas sp. S2893]TMP16970.1 sugar-binding protein [Pseudoalteromonas sp. S2893]
MQSNTVVLQGTSYPICLVAGTAKAPAGYEAVVTNTNESANRLVDQVSETLTSDPSKRIDTINLLISIGIEASKADDQRKTANSLIKAIAAGTIKCFREKVKYSIQVSDNTNSSSEDENSNKKTKTTASGKSASQAPVKNTGGAINNTASEEPIINQECRSDPVSMLSGEEILPLIDFTLAGSRQLVWRRLYRSSHADVCTTMGNGWRHDFMASLTEHYLPPPKVGPKQKGTYWLEYQDEHGAKHKFEKVKPGQSSYQLSSNLALHYQTNGKQVLVTPDDQHLTFKPGESAWLLEKIINEKGQSIAFYYDAKERLHRIEVNKVRGCVISYNAQGLLSKIAAYCTDKNNKQQLLSPLLASYEYDENKNLVQSTNQQNETERYAYNAANLLTKRTRASGFSHHFEWDSYSPSAKCIKQWGDNNTYTYQFEYNLERGETTCIDSRGHKEHFVHNAQGKLVKHTDPNGNVWQYTYNAQGQKLSEIKPDSSTTRYSYTPFGQLETITQPDGSQTHFAYNQLGQRVLTTLPDGQTITRKYSVAGLLQSETFGDGRTTLYSYDKLGQLTQHINKNGQITKFIWNEQGELLAKHLNDELIRYSYDSLGRVNATLNNAGLLTQYKYNEHGQLTQTIAFDENEPENKQHQYFSYDEAGRLISSQNSKGDTTEQHFEGLSQPHCVIQPDGSALHLTYDKERNLTAIERSDGHVYRISYDANENPTQITGFDGTLQQYKYDACNRLASVTQSNKRHVKIERDSLGRVTAQHASLASDSHIVNNANYYSYNLQGKITRAHNAQSTLKQHFDKGGRLLCAEQVNNQQQAHTLKYSYDEYGRRQTLTLPDSTTLKYSYNQFGQLSSINLLQTNSNEVELAKPLVTLSYDSQGNIKTQQFGNSITLTQQFDVFNRLTQQQLTHPAQALLDTCTYNYDSVNHLIARKEEGVSSHNINFEYNSLGQLIQQNLASGENTKTTQYQWDSFGNPVSQSRVQNNELAEQQTTEPNDNSDASDAKNKIESNQSESTRNVIHSEYSDSSVAKATNELSEDDRVIKGTTDADRLTHFGDSDFHYDEFGNQIRETGKGIKTRREYNAFNQLSCFNNNGTLTQYDYDPLGRRIAKHTEHGKIDYIWDNDQLIGECQHGEYTWYINLPNQFHPVALIKKGEVYYYHLDQLNTPRFVTNNKAEVVWENQADVYGYEEPEAEPGTNKEKTFTQPIRFQGQYLDEESGLHYNRYRYYSPKQQRFINQDPIGLIGGINHYQYAPNPVNWVDPFGLSCKENAWNTFLKNTKGHFNSTTEAADSYKKVKEVLLTPKAERPDPSTYLPQSYIDAHIAQFNQQGAGFISIQSWMLNPEYPTLPPRKFVGLKSEMDAIIAKYTQSGNDWRILRDELSLGENTDLSNDEITYITVDPGDERFEYDIPNGREGGAYDGEWIPGGKTKGGITEAALINSETVVHNNSLEELSNSFKSSQSLDNDEVIDAQKGQTLKIWSAPVKVDGRRVFQRNDLFDPNKVDGENRTNIQRMKKGRPPIGYDDQPVNLHHLIQREPGTIAEVGGEFHSKKTKVLHVPQYNKVNGEWVARKNYSFRAHNGKKSTWPKTRTGKVKQTDAQKAFTKWSSKYWIKRSEGFE